MRLIDADELIEHLRYLNDEGLIVELGDIIQVIEDEEPVEAISIDWLKRRFCQRGVYAAESYFRRREHVEAVIEEWRRRPQ